MDKTSSKVGVAIVQWNHSALTISLLEDITKCSENLHIAICENGSDAAHRSALSSYLLTLAANKKGNWQICLMENRNNSGFARATNVCIRALLDAGCEWIWLLNNDARVSETAIVHLVKQIAGVQPGIYGVSLREKTSEVIVGGYRFNLWSTCNYPLTSQQQFDETHNLDKFVSGASMVVHRDVFAQAGLLNESHFLYFEELDLTYRAHKAGYMQKLLHGVEVVHQGKGSSCGPAQSRKLIYHETWSMLNFYMQHKKMLLPWVVLVRNPIRIVRLLTTRRAHCVSSVLRAMVDFSMRRNADASPVIITETVNYSPTID